MGIRNIKLDFVPKPKVEDERENFREVMKIFTLSIEYLKDCTTAYRMIQNKHGEEKIPYSDLLTLERLIYRTRLVIHKIEEEYKIYESSLEQMNAFKKEKLVDQKHKRSLSTMYNRIMNDPSQTARKGKAIGNSEKDMENAIFSNLHKILPQKRNPMTLKVKKLQ